LLQPCLCRQLICVETSKTHSWAGLKKEGNERNGQNEEGKNEKKRKTELKYER
jgi:hypothetical protein